MYPIMVGACLTGSREACVLPGQSCAAYARSCWMTRHARAPTAMGAPSTDELCICVVKEVITLFLSRSHTIKPYIEV